MLSASEPARTATPIGKSASAFKLSPLTLLATLDDEETLELLTATLDGALEFAGALELEGILELEGTLELEGARELEEMLELDSAALDATLELPPTTP